MKEDSIEEVKKQLARVMAQNKQLIAELDVKSKAIQLLVVAGHLDKEKLEQATELADGF